MHCRVKYHPCYVTGRIIEINYIMKYLFILIAVVVSFTAQAQVKWIVRVNSKEVVKSTAENESKTIVTIKKADLAKAGSFTISYKKPESDSAWLRSIILEGVNDNSGMGITLDSSRSNKRPGELLFSIANADLKKMLMEKKKINIYTIAIPSDPARAAMVRVRRMHVGTIVLK